VSTNPDRSAWLHGAPADIAARPEVSYVVVDSHWAIREIVLETGQRVHGRTDRSVPDDGVSPQGAKHGDSRVRRLAG
jgi:hypothetical protein